MNRIIVADTGPLIAFAKLDQLQLLTHVFHTIYVPQIVLDEACNNSRFQETSAIAEFVKQSANLVPNINNELSHRLFQILDAGEVQAITHAKVLDCGVLIDEKRGRRVAKSHDVPVLGTLGLLIQLKKRGLLNQLKPQLDQLQQNGYRLSDALIREVLSITGESE